MFTPIDQMTREEKEAERDQLADFLARHRGCSREEVLANLFVPKKPGRQFQDTVTTKQMQRRVKEQNFEQGKIDGFICAEEMALKKGTPEYARAATAFFARCCAEAPGFEEVIAPGLFRHQRGLGWMSDPQAIIDLMQKEQHSVA